MVIEIDEDELKEKIHKNASLHKKEHLVIEEGSVSDLNELSLQQSSSK